jgi:hypothetical protein
MGSKLISGVAIPLVVGVTAATILAVQPPAWIMLLLGSMVLALLYIVARLRLHFDPSHPRFGGCIPPITKPRDQ